VLDDAQQLIAEDDFANYTTTTRFAEVVAFYQNTLAAAGYTFDAAQSSLDEPNALLTFTGNNTLTVVVSGNTDDSLQIFASRQ